MDIDMSALRLLEREKGISLEVVVEAIETALLSAYHKTADAHHHARVELDRTSGHVTVWAKERLTDAPADREDEAPVQRFSEEFDHTPEDFGRFAATVARQLIMQRLRDLEDEATYGEFSGRVGDVVSGVLWGTSPDGVLRAMAERFHGTAADEPRLGMRSLRGGTSHKGLDGLL